MEFNFFYFIKHKTWFSLNDFLYFLEHTNDFDSVSNHLRIRFYGLFNNPKFKIDSLFNFNINFNWTKRTFNFDNVFNFIEFIYHNIYNFDLHYFFIKLELNFILFKFFSLSLNRFINYKYWLYNYKWVRRLFEYNRIKIKQEVLQYRGFLSGFKFHCSGRFSRKQRAASVFFIDRCIPLSTLSSYVDYGFYTIPIENSAIGVKIWLYKRGIIIDYFLRVN